MSSDNQQGSRYGRVHLIMDVGPVRPKRVTSIGLDRMGGNVADQLVRHGVGTQEPGWMRLIDGDVVKPRNLVGSTVYRSPHVEMKKCEALASHLKEVNEEVNVRYWDKMLTSDDVPQVVDLARQSDLLGLFADEFDLMLQIADACHEICPMVMAMFGPRCDFAEVAFSIPGTTPRLRQVFGHRERRAIRSAQALGTDIVYVASFVASLCLRLLLGDAKGSNLLPCYANAPLYLVGLRREWIFANQPLDLIRSVVIVEASTDSHLPLPQGVPHADANTKT